MDLTERKITKIAREASKLAVRTLKEDGIGTAEYDFIHLVRHHPGITQAEVREQLRVDKGAAARRAASLEAKGYLIRQANPKDGRSQLLFATEKAEGLRNSKAQVETTFYEWLLAELPEAEKITCPSAWREMLAIRAMRLATSMSRWVQVGDLNMTVSETMAAAINPAILAVGIRPLS